MSDPTRQKAHKPTLMELMLDGKEDQPTPDKASGADGRSKAHELTLADLMAAGESISQSEPPKVEISLEEKLAEVLAESDRTQAEDQGQEQQLETDSLPQEAPQAVEAELVEAEVPQAVTVEAPETIEEEPVEVPSSPAAGAHPEVSEPAEGKTPSAPAPREPAKVHGIVEGPSVVARYGLMKHLGQFRHNLEPPPAPGTRIVVRTPRGVELAKAIVCICDDQRPGCITRGCLAAYATASEQNYPLRCEGKVLRVANQQDMADCERIRNSAKQEVAFCRQCAREMHLAIKTVSVDHLLGGGRIVFYFIADRRVDFRALVHKLSAQYHTRIEMRQVGARDEARLVADYEKCGRRCCCQAFLKDLKPVSMRMAKIQKASLDPAKISGRCGRLMCCMRFEDETYEELRRKLPAKKIWVRTAELVGKVIDTSILAQLVRISLADGRSAVIANEEIIERDVQLPATAGTAGGSQGAHPETRTAADATKSGAAAPTTRAPPT